MGSCPWGLGLGEEDFPGSRPGSGSLRQISGARGPKRPWKLQALRYYYLRRVVLNFF